MTTFQSILLLVGIVLVGVELYDSYLGLCLKRIAEHNRQSIINEGSDQNQLNTANATIQRIIFGLFVNSIITIIGLLLIGYGLSGIL